MYFVLPLFPPEKLTIADFQTPKNIPMLRKLIINGSENVIANENNGFDGFDLVKSVTVTNTRSIASRKEIEVHNEDDIVEIKFEDSTTWIGETKGREELDLPRKMARLRQWCEDATSAGTADGKRRYRFVYVDQKGFEQNTPTTFAALAASFTEYQIT